MVLGVQPPACGRMGKGGWIMEGDVKPADGAEEEVLLRVRGGEVDVVAGRGMTVLVMLTWLTSTGAMRSVLFLVVLLVLFLVVLPVLFLVLFVVLFRKAVGWRKRLPDAVGVSASVLLLNGYGGAAVATVRTERKAGVRGDRIFATFLTPVNWGCL